MFKSFFFYYFFFGWIKIFVYSEKGGGGWKFHIGHVFIIVTGKKQEIVVPRVDVNCPARRLLTRRVFFLLFYFLFGFSTIFFFVIYFGTIINKQKKTKPCQCQKRISEVQFRNLRVVLRGNRFYFYICDWWIWLFQN